MTRSLRIDGSYLEQLMFGYSGVSRVGQCPGRHLDSEHKIWVSNILDRGAISVLAMGAIFRRYAAIFIYYVMGLKLTQGFVCYLRNYVR